MIHRIKYIILLLLLFNITHANDLKIGFTFSLDDNLKVSPWVDISLTEFNQGKQHTFKYNEWHHLYIGIIIYGVGRTIESETIKTVGKILIIDDTIQHVFRVQTPFHKINDELWRYKTYSNACNFLNGR